MDVALVQRAVPRVRTAVNATPSGRGVRSAPSDGRPVPWTVRWRAVCPAPSMERAVRPTAADSTLDAGRRAPRLPDWALTLRPSGGVRLGVRLGARLAVRLTLLDASEIYENF